MDNEPLSVGEFGRWSQRTDRVLERIERKQDAQGEVVTAVKTRQDAADRRITVLEAGDRKSARKTASGWSAGIAAILVGVMEILHRVGVIK